MNRMTADWESTTYQGFPLVVTDRDVTVLDPQLRKLATVPSVKQARLFIKGYRKEAKA